MANRFASYRDMLNAGLFSSEANCLQYLLDVSILPTQKRCPSCTIITDKWKAYINLQNHGYVHLDVNHSQNFVDPESGAHTNRIEGTWTHVKNRAQRRGGRRSPDHLARDLTEFMWLRQKGLLSSADRARLMFARELPQLLNFQNFV